MEKNKNHKVNRCPKCGSSDIEYDINKQKLVCNYCHNEFDQVIEQQDNIKNLHEYKISDGSKAIINDSDSVVLKCDNCGAEIIFNIKDNNYRCHWCHSVLPLDSSLGNGMAPDLILPFKLKKEEAFEKIQEFVNKRKFFADKKFIKEFKSDNIIGVYFPYFLVDCNAHASFKGEGGHLLKTYSSSDDPTEYDIEISSIEREFDIVIDDLEIETSSEKANKNNSKKTINIINSIMPFDTENCVKYQSNYLVGYSAEKRDLNIIDLQDKMDKSLRDVIRYRLNKDLKKYDSGIRWDEQNISIKGRSVMSAYLPVWLYSYLDDYKVLHYVAVNARTGEVMGNVPFNKTKLELVSVFIPLTIFMFITILAICIDLGSFITGIIQYITINTAIFVLIGFIIYRNNKAKYSNYIARHSYENQTKTDVTYYKINEKYLRVDKRVFYKVIPNANNTVIEGDTIPTDNRIVVKWNKP